MKSIKMAAAAAGLACSLFVPFTAHAGLTTLSNLFVFGDSLADGGNSGLVTGGFPPPPYADGRYSNGPTAVEQLWQAYNPGDTSFRPSLAGGTNYAIGGATTGSASYNSVNPAVPDFLRPAFDDKGAAWQLQAFQNHLASGNTFDPASSLFVVWLFPNDVFYALTTGQLPGQVPGSPGGGNLISNGIANIVTIVGTLAALGAEHILVPNMPDLGATPAFAGTPSAGDLSALTALFNSNLAAQLSVLDAFLPDTEIVQFDTAAFFADAIANPGAFGLENVSGQCVLNLGTGPGQCNPADNRWLFWDGVHPTTYAHGLLAGRFVAAVPEPGSLALLTLGLFSVFATRRRRAA
ncbi:MAG: PEP-CTERM sorting domain-containing protein [Rubrivivax sp.]|nr:PEP-CTERM sorting domain-containing protein [Rubrivivax sp.]